MPMKNNLKILYGLKCKYISEKEIIWESTNYDPQFKIISQEPYNEWVRLSYMASSEEQRDVKIYLDYGQGYSKENSIELNHIRSGEVRKYNYYLYIGEKVKQIRLDAGSIPGLFKLYNLEILNIPLTCNEPKTKFSLIIPYKERKNQYIKECIESIKKQKYKNYEILIVKEKNAHINIDGNDKKINIINSDYTTFYELVNEAMTRINGNYAVVIEQEDFISENMLVHFNNVISESSEWDMLYADEDRYDEENLFYAPVYKNYYAGSKKIKHIGKGVCIKKELLLKVKYSDILNNYDQYDSIYINKVLYHKRVGILPCWEIENSQKIKPIAFYLPQFHSIPENDEWWGKGFTEWTNVKRAIPMFKDHYQRHEPGDLGYYDLVSDKSIQYKQVEIAKKYGIHGFCFYYYRFNDKRLLEKPLNQFIDNKGLDFPFCICWANETWSRRWNGSENEVLILQNHDEDSDKKFIEELIPILKDKRYIRIGDAPLILIYRVDLFKNMKKSVELWRKKCKDSGIEKIHICAAQAFGCTDPRPYGCDSAVEFPPHNICYTEISNQVKELNKNFSGNIFDYKEVVNLCNFKKDTDYTLFRGCMLGFDNTPRRMYKSAIYTNVTPLEYRKWLFNIKDYTERFNDSESQYFFINAWNEWAEGTHLEPDKKYGYSYLEETLRMIDSR